MPTDELSDIFTVGQELRKISEVAAEIERAATAVEETMVDGAPLLAEDMRVVFGSIRALSFLIHRLTERVREIA